VPVLALILAAAIGLSLGTLGGGGSVLTVPVLVYLVGYDPKVAVPTSLAVVGSASLMGAFGHWRAGRVDLRVALSFGLVAIVGSYLGAKLALRMQGEVQLAILAVVMVTAAVLMLRGGSGGKSDGDDAVGVAWEDRAAALRHIVRLAPVAAGVGLLTGVVGIGGGFLIVPALVIWGGVPMATAVGTSLFVITLNCIAGLVGYVGHVAIPWAGTLLFTAVAVAGSAAGSAIVGKIPQQRLRRIFAVFLLGVGGFIMYRNRAVLVGAHSLVRSWPSGTRASDTPSPAHLPATPPR
jgi:uncharacterized membrane protein YfcA